MSYHILHQFDEQWLAEVKQDAGASKRKSFLDSGADEYQPARHARIAARESKRWAVVAVSILLATFALLFSIDATRRAENLQRRLDVLETSVKK